MNINETIQELKSKSLNYWEEAEAFRDIVENGMTQTDLARMLGLKQTTISNKIRLLKLPAEVQKVIKEQGLLERYARVLLRVHDESQQLEIIDRICKYNLNIRSTEDYISKYIRVSHDLRDIKGFTSIVIQGVKTLKSKGINVGSKKVDRENCTDLIIRFYK